MNPLSLHVADGLAHLTLTRPEPRIDDALLAGLHAALDRCEAEGVSVLILRGQPTVFCAGGDFGALVESGRTDPGGGVADPAPLYDLWLRLTEAPFVSVSVVRGRVNAGGVGLVAATDLVIAEPGASFALSELLFGLFPACVLPFLVRRVGAQRAHQLTLTTRPTLRTDFQAADGGKTAVYMLRWVSTRGEKGPWSEIATATVAA